MLYLMWLLTIITGWIITTEGTISSTTKPIWNATWTDNLKHDLLLSYDKFARPTQHYNQTVVKIKLTIRHIDIDEEKSTMKLNGWTFMSWTDDKLKWTPTVYGGLSTLHLADHEIWQPDILVYNTASGSSLDHYGRTNCVIYNNGDVIWVPPSRFETYCDLNLKLWPYDSHVCGIKLGSWTHDGNLIDLNISGNGIESELALENYEWQITEINVKRNEKIYSCCEEPYPDIEYSITIVRRSAMFKTVVVTPASIVVLITLSSFWLPPQAGEKILLNGINAIIIVIQLLYFSQKLPSMAFETPLIVLFYSASLYLVAFSTIIAIIVINLSRTKKEYAIPWTIKKLLDGRFGTLLGLRGLNVKQLNQQPNEELREQPFEEHVVTSDDHQMIQCVVTKAPIQLDWILLSIAIDRISFLVYCLIFALLAIIYSI